MIEFAICLSSQAEQSILVCWLHYYVWMGLRDSDSFCSYINPSYLPQPNELPANHLPVKKLTDLECAT